MRNLTFLAIPLILALLSSVGLGEDVKGGKEPPKSISVKEVLAILAKSEVTGQGCGFATWNGQGWSYCGSSYKSVVLPWSLKSEEVSAGAVFGKVPGESHLIDFSGPGFCYRRTTDSPTLTLVEPAK